MTIRIDLLVNNVLRSSVLMSMTIFSILWIVISLICLDHHYSLNTRSSSGHVHFHDQCDHVSNNLDDFDISFTGYGTGISPEHSYSYATLFWKSEVVLKFLLYCTINLYLTTLDRAAPMISAKKRRNQRKSLRCLRWVYFLYSSYSFIH